MTEAENAAAVLERQRELYGASLGELFDQLTDAYALSRAQLADALGVSAPMLSQLGLGHRIKLGNSAAVERMQVMLLQMPQVRAGEVDGDAVIAKMQADDTSNVFATTSRILRRGAVAELQQLLQRAASVEEIKAAAGLIEATHPRLAEVLLIYGTDSLESAESLHKKLFEA